MTPTNEAERCSVFADALRVYWSFDDNQQHTHNWHSREDFISKALPKLLKVLTDPAQEIAQLRKDVEILATELKRVSDERGVWIRPLPREVLSRSLTRKDRT